MKRLEIKKMENVQGGASSKECFYIGVGITLTALGGFIFAPLWGATAAITFTSGDCF